ncbi:MAG: hypothetical protein A2049_02050 [Elusimicrobia bacterium GWA2_62_23]|nr:MAG: hypothetical protein A2049_02050 [Elusimicrobia bacterium GWA2_62_23]
MAKIKPYCACVALWLALSSGAAAQIELGVVDDISGYGVDGTAYDPDLEIKGFTVFGATQAGYPGISAAPGNVVVNGALSVSSGVYFVGDSTFTAASKIFINDGSSGQILSKNASGSLQWTNSSAIGDNLGNHTAATRLNMGNYAIWSSSDITAVRYQIGGFPVLHMTSGAENIAVGLFAGDSNTTGHANTFLGHAAGYSNTTGQDNTFLGAYAGESTTEGSWNTFVGETAGDGNVSGGNNTAMGAQAGYYSPAGSANAMLGAGAGFGVSGNSFSSSTLVGYGAGYGLTTGSDNILLGFQAGDNLTTGSRNIIIGYDKDAPAATTSDHINIGGLLHGDMAQSTMTVYGDLYADKFHGDGSGLTGLPASPGDSLGTHVATQTLNMAQFPVINVSSIVMLGDGIRIATSVYAGASGIFVSTSGQILTLGSGNGSSIPGIRGVGAVDLQNRRSSQTQVASGAYAVISGGINNLAGGDYSVVSGGLSNSAVGQYSVVIGGSSGSASGQRAVVGGGIGNVASGDDAVVMGGGLNIVSGTGGAVGGGYSNVSNSSYSTIPGGHGNTAKSNGSFAAGNYSSSTALGSFTWADYSGGAGNVTENNVADRTLFKNRGGFLITGSTNVYMTGALNRGMLVTGNGLVGISTGVPYAALDIVSTGTAANILAQVWRNGAGVLVGSMSSTGNMYVNGGVRVGDGTAGAPSISFNSETNTGFHYMSPAQVGWASGGVTRFYFGNSIISPDPGGVGLRSSNGTASDPAYFFQGDGDTGMFSPNFDWLGFATNGVQRLTISDIGAVGIRTSTPYAALDAVSTGTAANIMAQLWRDGSGAIVSSMSSTGVMMATRFVGDGSGLINLPAGAGGDSLGTHIATQTLNMATFNIINVGSITTNAAITTYSSITAAGNMTAARYQINGSTIVAILPGVNSIAYGVYAGTSNITGGDYNVFIGNYAGASNTTGSYNTANGYSALRYNTTGGQNTANGDSALGSNTTGLRNTANGDSALGSNTTGGQNTANGAYALYYNTGNNNTANGYSALYSNRTGGDNTASGYKALYWSRTGSANSIMGYQAGFGIDGDSFSSSTIMGYQAGYSLTTGSDNTFLGWQAGYNVTSGTGNIIIGYDQRTPVDTTNNFLNVGGVLFGNLSSKTIGISTRIPQAALDIVSTGTASNIMAQLWRDGSGAIVSSMSSTGVMMATRFVGDGSGLTGIAGGSSGPAIDVSTINAAAATPYGGVNITTNTFIQGNVSVGTTSAAAFDLEIANAAAFFSEYNNGSSGTAKTLDWLNGNKQVLTLTGNVTLTFSAPAGKAASFLLRLVQDGAGGRTVVWPAAVKWRGGVPGRLSTAANAVDIISLYYSGTNYYACASTSYQ